MRAGKGKHRLNLRFSGKALTLRAREARVSKGEGGKDRATIPRASRRLLLGLLQAPVVNNMSRTHRGVPTYLIRCFPSVAAKVVVEGGPAKPRQLTNWREQTLPQKFWHEL